MKVAMKKKLSLSPRPSERAASVSVARRHSASNGAMRKSIKIIRNTSKVAAAQKSKMGSSLKKLKARTVMRGHGSLKHKKETAGEEEAGSPYGADRKDAALHEGGGIVSLVQEATRKISENRQAEVKATTNAAVEARFRESVAGTPTEASPEGAKAKDARNNEKARVEKVTNDAACLLPDLKTKPSIETVANNSVSTELSTSSVDAVKTMHSEGPGKETDEEKETALPEMDNALDLIDDSLIRIIDLARNVSWPETAKAKVVLARNVSWPETAKAKAVLDAWNRAAIGEEAAPAADTATAAAPAAAPSAAPATEATPEKLAPKDSAREETILPGGTEGTKAKDTSIGKDPNEAAKVAPEDYAREETISPGGTEGAKARDASIGKEPNEAAGVAGEDSAREETISPEGTEGAKARDASIGREPNEAARVAPEDSAREEAISSGGTIGKEPNDVLLGFFASLADGVNDLSDTFSNISSTTAVEKYNGFYQYIAKLDGPESALEDLFGTDEELKKHQGFPYGVPVQERTSTSDDRNDGAAGQAHPRGLGSDEEVRQGI